VLKKCVPRVEREREKITKNLESPPLNPRESEKRREWSESPRIEQDKATTKREREILVKKRKKHTIMGWRVRGSNPEREEVMRGEVQRRSGKKIFR